MASPSASLIAAIAVQARLAGFSPSRPSSLRSSGGVLGNRATAGMPSATASRARSTISATGQRLTPGRVAIGCSSLPDVTNSGQIRSDGVTRCSRWSARLQPVMRGRRRRVAGYWLMTHPLLPNLAAAASGQRAVRTGPPSAAPTGTAAIALIRARKAASSRPSSVDRVAICTDAGFTALPLR